MNSEIENIENLMNNKEVQFRRFDIRAQKKEDEEDTMLIQGTPIVFEKETCLYKTKGFELHEIIDRNACDDADISDVILNINHCGRVYARTRNDSLKLGIDEDGMQIEAIVKKNDDGRRALYNDLSEGLLDRMSFAFKIKEKEETYIENADGNDIVVCRITKIEKIYDVSIVDIPAYDETSVSARRLFDAVSKRMISEREAKRKLAMKIKIERSRR